MTHTSCSPPGGKQGHYLGQDHLTCGSCLSLNHLIHTVCIPEQNVHLIHCHILRNRFRVYLHMHKFFTLTFRALGRNTNFLNILSKISFPILKFVCSLAVRFFIVVFMKVILSASPSKLLIKMYVFHR